MGLFLLMKVNSCSSRFPFFFLRIYWFVLDLASCNIRKAVLQDSIHLTINPVYCRNGVGWLRSPNETLLLLFAANLAISWVDLSLDRSAFYFPLPFLIVNWFLLVDPSPVFVALFVFCTGRKERDSLPFAATIEKELFRCTGFKQELALYSGGTFNCSTNVWVRMIESTLVKFGGY